MGIDVDVGALLFPLAPQWCPHFFNCRIATDRHLQPNQIIGLFFTTSRLLMTKTGSCRSLNLCWFKNTNQSFTQTSHRYLVALTNIRASSVTSYTSTTRLAPVITIKSHWVTWLLMLRATTSLLSQLPWVLVYFCGAVFLPVTKKT